MFFYHLVPKGADISNGIVSLWWQYLHDRGVYRKNSNKYRNRLCTGWGIYPGRTPESLSDEEVLKGIQQFRNSKNGANQIYLFRHPPYCMLGKQMQAILSFKDIYRIDPFSQHARKYIRKLFFGYENSFTGNRKLNLHDYQISPKEYFQHYTETGNGLLFAQLHHIAIEPVNGYLPAVLWEKIETPIHLEDVEELYGQENIERSTVLFRSR